MTIKSITMFMPIETHTRLKVVAAIKKESMQAMMRRVLLGYLDFAEEAIKKGGGRP